jgi:hypothetical protein
MRRSPVGEREFTRSIDGARYEIRAVDRDTALHSSET